MADTMTDTTEWEADPSVFSVNVDSDDAVGRAWNTRYRRKGDPGGDGAYAIVDEDWYVAMYGNDKVGYFVDVVCRTYYGRHTNPNDPGGSEMFGDYDYDREWTINGFVSLPEAEREAKRLACSDTADQITWDGEVFNR